MSPDTLWRMANIVDNVHYYVVTPGMFLVIFYLIYTYGNKKLWRQQRLTAGFVQTVLGLQAVYMNCPMLVFSHWLRSFKNPYYDTYQDSWVHAIYQKVGPLATLHWAVAIVAFGLAVHNFRCAWLPAKVARNTAS